MGTCPPHPQIGWLSNLRQENLVMGTEQRAHKRKRAGDISRKCELHIHTLVRKSWVPDGDLTPEQPNPLTVGHNIIFILTANIADCRLSDY
jgi:hypothetical protein